MPTCSWTHRLTGPVAGVSLARESGHVAAWDVNRWLVLLNRRGVVQGQVRIPAIIVAAAISDDGSAIVAADDRGEIVGLNRDLSARFRLNIGHKPTAVAVDSLGRGFAVADSSNRLRLFDTRGRDTGHSIGTPRPLYHLHFLAAEPFLLAAADFGHVAMLDLRNRQWFWQDGPITHLGDIAASGDGSISAVACFSDGIRRYDLAGRPMSSVPTAEPVRHLCATYDAARFLTASILGTIAMVNEAGARRDEQRFDQPVAGIAWSPLGDSGVAALADGRVIGLQFDRQL